MNIEQEQSSMEGEVIRGEFDTCISEYDHLINMGVNTTQCDANARSFFADLLNDSKKQSTIENSLGFHEYSFTDLSSASATIAAGISFSDMMPPLDSFSRKRKRSNRNLNNVEKTNVGESNDNEGDSEEEQEIKDGKQDEIMKNLLLLQSPKVARAMATHEAFQTSYTPSNLQRSNNVQYYENRFFLFQGQSIGGNNDNSQFQSMFPGHAQCKLSDALFTFNKKESNKENGR